MFLHSLMLAGLALQEPASTNHFGLRSASAGDLDGDGTPDVLIADTSRHEDAHLSGRVWVYSPKQDRMLDVLDGAFDERGKHPRFGSALAALGDVDGDGVPDFAVGAASDTASFWDGASGTTPGYVRVYSGRNRRVLWEAHGTRVHDGFGTALAVLGDLDGDGVSDLAVGAPGRLSGTMAHRRGYVRILSGRDGTVLRTIEEPIPTSGGAKMSDRDEDSNQFGFSVIGPGDLDGDRIPDLVVGAPGLRSGKARGGIEFISGATGALLRVVTGVDPRGRPGLEFGRRLAAVGDLDSDGVPDVLTGRIDVSVSLHSGKDGTLLRELEDPERYGYLRGFGDSLAAIGDVDGDGIGDFAIGCEEHIDSGDAYDVTIVSGKSFTVLKVLESNDRFLVVAPAGDLDGDGVPDLLVGRWEDGIVEIYSGKTWRPWRTIRRPSSVIPSDATAKLSRTER
jgi:hypothetical protein